LGTADGEYWESENKHMVLGGDKFKTTKYKKCNGKKGRKR